MTRYRYAYNALVYCGEDISGSIDGVARYGYDAIEVGGERAEFDPRRIKRLSDDAGHFVRGLALGAVKG
ncbi:MAG: hypothetical protein ACRDJC_22305 [Thermomicrobiales bacterium]